MGWTLSPFGYWWQGMHGESVLHAGETWRPDEKWYQCGMVIEAMRKKGWDFQVRETDGERAAWAVFWKDDPEIDGHGHAAKILPAVCQAAYRALGGTERVKMGDFVVDYPPKIALL